jgi:hypothetical protein
MQEAYQKAVFFFGIVFAFVGTVLDFKLEEGRFVAGHFSVESFFDADSSLDFGFTFLDLSQYAIRVLKLLVAFPKRFRVVKHFFRGLSFYLLG